MRNADHLTVIDRIRTHEQTTAAERQTTFNDMIKIALDVVLLGDKGNTCCAGWRLRSTRPAVYRPLSKSASELLLAYCLRNPRR